MSRRRSVMHAPRLVLHGETGLVLVNTGAMRFDAQLGSAFVGLAGLERFKEGRVELYFTIFKAYRRRGFATDAASTLCVWAFEQLGLPRLGAIANKNNRGSRHVLEQSGFIICKVDAALLHYERHNTKLSAQ